MKSLIIQLIGLSSILILLSGCETAKVFRHDKQEVNFFNNKGEINTNLSIDINSTDLGFNLAGAFAATENVFIMGGASNYSSKYLPVSNVITPDETEESSFTLKGSRVRAGVGYYNNFGGSRTGYFEFSGDLGLSWNEFNSTTPDLIVGRSKWNYTPVNLGINFAIGKNSPSVGIAFGLRVEQIWYGGPVPYEINSGWQNVSVNSYIEQILVITPSFNLRAGSGKVKGLFQFGFGVSPFVEDPIFVDEPTIKLSFGVNYVLNRAVPKKSKVIEIEL